MELHLRILTIKIIFFFQTSAVLFLPFFKYFVAFQDQSEGYIGESEIIDTIEVIVL